MSSDKIFVDLDEEIIFTVEKILEKSAKRIIVVIPESANLVASLISLKLLARQIADSDKHIVAVTEDKLGLKLSKKAGIIAKSKISDITPKVWIEAEELKKKFVSDRKKLKDQLINDRTEGGGYKIVDGENSGKQEEPANEQQNDKEITDEKVLESKEADKINEQDQVGEDNSFAYAPPLGQKPRLDPKVVNFGSIKVLAGGDIERQAKYLSEIENISHPEVGRKEEEIKEADSKATKNDISDEKEVKAGQDKQKGVDTIEQITDSQEKPVTFIQNGSQFTSQDSQKPDLIGRDWSSYMPEDNKKRGRVQYAGGAEGKGLDVGNTLNSISGSGIMKKIQELRLRVVAFYKTGNTKLKISITAGIVILFIYVMSAYVFASASVTLNVSKANVSVNEQVTASTTAVNVDYGNKVVPIRQIKVNSSSSNSGDTTGQAKDGDKAKGLITIYNKEEREIQLASGTIVTNITTNLEYKLTSSITVTAAVIDAGGTVNVGVNKDVPVEAASYGESYNTTGSASYKITGYTTDQLSAKSFDDIEGGTTSEDKAVDQKDIDNLQNGLVEELKNSIKNEMEELVSEDELLLEDTIAYGSPSVESDKKVGETATNVTITVDLEAAAYVVSRADLRSYISEAIKSSSDFEGEVDQEDLVDPVVEEVAVNGENVSFTLRSQGDIVAGITESEVAENISGKSIGNADDYLDSIEGIESYDLSVSPFYIPSMLKKVPSESRIEVHIKTSSQ